MPLSSRLLTDIRRHIYMQNILMATEDLTNSRSADKLKKKLPTQVTTTACVL